MSEMTREKLRVRRDKAKLALSSRKKQILQYNKIQCFQGLGKI